MRGHTLLVMLSASTAIGAHAQIAAQMPVIFAEGERWEWDLVITPDVGAARNPSRTVVPTADGLRLQNHRGVVYGLAVPFESGPFFNTKSVSTWRQWPLEVGKSWQFEGEFRPGNATATLKQTATVVAFEEVTVPAGKFQAYRIEYKGTASAGGQNWSRNEVYWFAPSAKADVKATIETPTHKGTMELITLKPAP